jgi:hypothetical protein
VLYKDAAHTQLLGKHRQEVLFSISPGLKPQVEKEYSIRVL